MSSTRVLGLALSDPLAARARERLATLRELGGVDVRSLPADPDGRAPDACLIGDPRNVARMVRTWGAPVVCVLDEDDAELADVAVASGARDCLSMTDPTWRWSATLQSVLDVGLEMRSPALALARTEGLLNRELCRLVGHELGNQMNGVGTALQVLLRELAPDSRGRALGEAALRSIRETNTRLRLYLQGLRGHPPLRAAVPVGEVLEAANALLVAAGRPRTVARGEWPSTDLVRVDRDLLRVALFVLLDLAPVHAEVKIEGELAEGRLRVSSPSWVTSGVEDDPESTLRLDLVRRAVTDAGGRLSFGDGGQQLLALPLA